MKVNKCRICKSKIVEIFSLGNFPAVNYYLSKNELEKKEEKYSLTFCLCENCGLGQLNEIVSADKLFLEYHYMSSTSYPLMLHLESLAELCRNRFKLNSLSNALDIGCNDGILLNFLKNHKIFSLGIDPAENAIKDAKNKDITVIKGFFNEAMSTKILVRHGKFDLIVATNTLAQIIDLNDFVKGVRNLLNEDGVFVIEVGYLLDMINKKTFDSIYHEHYSYFSLRSLMQLFRAHSLDVFDAQRIANHGGSLRVFIKHHANKKFNMRKRLEKIKKNEELIKLHKSESYKEFASNIFLFRKDFRNLLLGLKKDNQEIIGLGAPAKSVVLLNFVGINNKVISYITDSTSHKQHKYMPGVHIPIMPEEKIITDKNIDYFLLLAWTYKKEMVNKIKKLKRDNVKIIIPFPRMRIINV